LTPRQVEVVALVASGWTNARIAEALEMSVKTVEKHVRDVFVRWGVPTRTAVAALWQQHHASTGLDEDSASA
jgi:DNA-binding NarL/FixJ family response regulator